VCLFKTGKCKSNETPKIKYLVQLLTYFKKAKDWKNEMKKEILISLEANEKRVAILEDGKLQEFFIERADANRMFGNVYKGRVKSVIPGIQAAFVDLGTKKDGFLYVADAVEASIDLDSDDEIARATHSPRDRKFRTRIPSIEKVLKEGQEVTVQVVKESIRDKGPRLTTHIALPARCLVLIPRETKNGISKRIEDVRERDRIRQILQEIEMPKDCGFIVRTAGEGKSKQDLSRDVRYLAKTWHHIKTHNQKRHAPALLHRELDLVERMIRDLFTVDTARLVVDRQDLYQQVKRFLRVYLPGQKVQIEWYRGNIPLFERYRIEKDIEKTFHKKVFLRSGGHIVIEQTEGLVAIDVNTGKFTGQSNLEETVYRTNLEAAQEVARQVRLRDMGGIIIIDFIDMTKSDHRWHLYKLFQDAMRRDRAKTNILPMSELGLIEMTRQRIRASLESSVYGSCPYCEGKGSVKSIATMAIQTIKEIKKTINHSRERVLNVYVHPNVAEKLLNEEQQLIRDIARYSKSKIIILADPSLHREDTNVALVK
jgi:ribonuclease G